MSYLKKLNERQLAFCNYILEGLSKDEAYEKAGYSAKQTIGVNASKLLQNENVAGYLAEKRAIIDADTVYKRELMLEKYWEIAEMAKDSGRYGDAKNAYDSISKMLGYFESEKLSVKTKSGDSETEIVVNII